ncbi:MAG: glycosyltransferase, partial [Nitrospinaceae bacterium]
MKSLHILHTEAAKGWGGQEIRVLQETTLLLDRGHKVSLICQIGSPLEEHCRSFAHSRFDFKSISMDRVMNLRS